MSAARLVRIGGASGMWGDSAIATPQLLNVPGLAYLSYDYLAETTMAILARAQARDAGTGYATDFVAVAMAEHLALVARRGVKVLSNAGGLNPLACRDALRAVVRQQGLDLRIAAVTGDDVRGIVADRRARGASDVEGRPLPGRFISANAYLGARAVRRALDLGADVVVTGRMVDSAFVVAALAHEFGWRWDDWDRLAQATLAGHVIECGAQATGGLFTDWQDVPGWDAIGYPVVECEPDGTFVVTKPEGTGGLVIPPAVAEQIVYEIGDPAAYAMPDVTVDLRGVRVEPAGEHRVRVSGARGAPPPDRYRVSATYEDGFRLETLLAIRGRQAQAKAARTAEALVTRTQRLMHERGFDDYDGLVVEQLGAEALYGPHARVRDTREVVLRIAARHRERGALEFLRREAASAGISMGPGTRGHFGGRPDVQPVVRLCTFEVPKSEVRAVVHLGAVDLEAAGEDSDPAADPGSRVIGAPGGAGVGRTRQEPGDAGPPPAAPTDASTVGATLLAVAHARSGDKGDTSNIGVIARGEEEWEWLRANLHAATVRRYFAHLVEGDVVRHELPGLRALNFVMARALGGGGTASLRSDPLGKSFAQMLLDLPVEIPARLAPAQEGPPGRGHGAGPSRPDPSPDPVPSPTGLPGA